MLQSILNDRRSDNDIRLSLALGPLRYMPDVMVEKVVKDMIEALDHDNDYFDRLGYIERFDFWPRWKPVEKDVFNVVVPDAFIRFEKLDVIINVKRSRALHKNADEWGRIFRSYEREYGCDRCCILISLGGDGSDRTRVDLEWHDVYQVSWFTYKQCIENISRKLNDCDLTRCFDDIVAISNYMGYKDHPILDDGVYEELDDGFRGFSRRDALMH